MHGDVVFEVGVGHEDLRFCPRHPRKKGLEIGSVELEALFESNHELARVGLDEVLHALRVVLPVFRVLGDERDLDRFLELSRSHQRVQEVHLGRGQYVHRRQGTEHPLAPPVDAARSGAPGKERDAVTLGHHALGLDELGAVTTDHGVDLVLGDELFHELGALGCVRGVIEESEIHSQLPAPEIDASRIVDLFDRELGRLLVGAADLGLLAGHGQDGTDPDRLCFRGATGGGRARKSAERREQEQGGS